MNDTPKKNLPKYRINKQSVYTESGEEFGFSTGVFIVTIEDGKFAGITYKYDEMKFAEEANEDGTLTTDIKYTIISVPDRLKDVELGDDVDAQWNEILGNIIIDIIDQQIAEGHKLPDGVFEDCNKPEKVEL